MKKTAQPYRKKTTTFPLRLTSEEHKALRIHAIQLGQPLCDVIRERFSDVLEPAVSEVKGI